MLYPLFAPLNFRYNADSMEIDHTKAHHPAFLYSIGTSVPDYQRTQGEIMDFMISTAKADLPEEEVEQTISFLRTIYERTEIEQRNSVIPDFGAASPNDHSFFPSSADLEPLPTVEDRMRVYEREVPGLAETAAREALNKAGITPDQITHLVFTSCTGHFAPGPGIQLIQQLGLSPSVRRVLVGFMGCYAGFNSLRTSAEIVRGQPDATVLQICLELCTLHFQKDFSRNGIVSDCLFSDGCAAAVIGGPDRAASNDPLAKLGPSHSKVDADHQTKMTWRIGKDGFQMYLDPEVPDRLNPHIQPFVSKLKSDIEQAGNEIEHWAIHPGGSKILRIVSRVLDLPKQKIQPSLNVLNTFGNMSSPTVFFILDRIIGNTPIDECLCALGFGPGLSLEGMMFTSPS